MSGHELPASLEDSRARGAGAGSELPGRRERAWEMDRKEGAGLRGQGREADHSRAPELHEAPVQGEGERRQECPGSGILRA